MDLHEPNLVRLTCAPALAGYLERELEQLGYTVVASSDTGVDIQASLHDAMRLNLYLRTAYHVLYLLREFNCSTPDELYRQTSLIEWENLLPPDEYLCVVSRVDHPSINNWMYASQKVKDAIVDRMMERVGRRPESGPRRDHFVVSLFWRHDRAWLYLNTSGEKLSDRNYRKIPHKAPMQETLAAAVLMATGYDGMVPLVNPMCGSGTVAIEAALIATGRPPGLLRSNFGLIHLKGFDLQAWDALRREAHKSKKTLPPARIIATDINPEAVEVTRRNAMTAGVDHLIELRTCDFAETPLPADKGIIILNPEYGERLGQIDQLEKTYERIGDFLKQRCSGHTGYIFTGNMNLAKRVGLKASRRIPFFNAKIECRLLKYELYEGTRKHQHHGNIPQSR